MQQQGGSMPRRVDAEAARTTIVQATIQVISELGLERTTMREIARRAGCTTGRVTYFFADKEALLVAALAELRLTASRTLAAAAAGYSGIAALRRFVLATLPDPSVTDDETEHWRVWLTLWNEALTKPYAASEWDRRAGGYELLLRQHVESAKALGELRDDIDTDTVIRLLATTVYGASVDAMLRPRRYKPDVMEALVDTMLQSLSEPTTPRIAATTEP
jgi:AcrR family transcriptional regulator